MESQTRSDPGSFESHLENLRSLLTEILRHGGFDLSFEIRHQTVTARDDGIDLPEVLVDFSGPDTDLLLQAHAELLNALEYVALKAVRLEEDLFHKISFDCQGYRLLRIEELKLIAQVAAERVIETHDPYPLGPMNPRERRIVHLALKDQPAVRTASEGFGSERKVVITPAPKPSRR